MNKYYRVRSQKQWDWLIEHLELEYPLSSTTFLADSIFMDLKDDQQLVPKISIKSSNINKIIEVSKLMEDEKMENYITIKGEDLEKVHWETSHWHSSFINRDENGEKYVHEQFLPANLIIPKSLVQQKVKMTQAEKKEFDKLKDEMNLGRYDLDDLLTRIKDSEDYPHLYHRLYMADGDGVESQLEFARAWADPSLIEVTPEKRWNVKVPKTELFYLKTYDEHTLRTRNKEFNDVEDQQFTADELKEYGLDSDLYEKVEVKE